MAEAFLNKLAGDRFAAESAGLEAGQLNPLVVAVMKEKGIDISKNKTKRAQDFLDMGKTFDYVVTVCDETSAEKCPIFPGKTIRLHWGFEDPSRFAGTNQEKLDRTRQVRDQIEKCVADFIKKFEP